MGLKKEMTITDIVERIRGKFPEMIWMAKEYSKADMIEDLLEIEKRLAKKKKKKCSINRT